MNINKDNETIRQQVWLEAWTKTAQSSSCTSTSVATKFADECLKQFDERFINKE